jgi:hypothetical protein
MSEPRAVALEGEAAEMALADATAVLSDDAGRRIAVVAWPT